MRVKLTIRLLISNLSTSQYLVSNSTHNLLLQTKETLLFESSILSGGAWSQAHIPLNWGRHFLTFEARPIQDPRINSSHSTMFSAYLGDVQLLNQPCLNLGRDYFLSLPNLRTPKPPLQQVFDCIYIVLICKHCHEKLA